MTVGTDGPTWSQLLDAEGASEDEDSDRTETPKMYFIYQVPTETFADRLDTRVSHLLTSRSCTGS